MVYKLRSIFVALLISNFTIFSFKADAFQPDIRSCAQVQSRGPIQIKVAVEGTIFSFKAKYRLIPLPLVDVPAHIHLFENLELRANNKLVLISPSSVESLMAIFGYTGQIEYQINEVPTQDEALILNQNLSLVRGSTKRSVSAISILESSYGTCP